MGPATGEPFWRGEISAAPDGPRRRRAGIEYYLDARGMRSISAGSTFKLVTAMGRAQRCGLSHTTYDVIRLPDGRVGKS